jgi:purine-binding chemotaxis protein CheW
MTDYLTLRVGQQWYGVAVEQVIEAMYLIAFDDLPGAPPDVLGLMTLREQVMPVIDLRVRFGMDDAPLTLHTPIVAISSGGRYAGLVVDQVSMVVVVDETVGFSGHASPHIRTAVRLDDERLLYLLDVGRVLADAVPAD